MSKSICDICDKEYATIDTLRRHKRTIHNPDVVWLSCDQRGCKYQSVDKNNLTRHKAHKHHIGVKWHHCYYPDCNKKYKGQSTLDEHIVFNHATIHIFECSVDGCDYQSKDKSNMTRHKANKHDIGVKWHYCAVSTCDYKSKVTSDLNRHQMTQHNIIKNNTFIWYACHICKSKSRTSMGLDRHLSTMHDQ